MGTNDLVSQGENGSAQAATFCPHASFTCGDQTLKARPGSFIFFPRDIPHWFRIEGTESARLLQLNFPAGLEHFFVEAGEPAPELTLPPAEPPNVGKLVAIAAKYNQEILGPPPA
jgi:hypothetical protein